MNELDLNQLSGQIIGGAIAVHRAIGPGLLESAYEACLAYELTQAGLHVEKQKPLPITYREITLDVGYRMDMVINQRIIVELKAVDALAPIHEAQLLSYLKLSGYKLGLLINFNVKRLRDGIKRLAN